MFEKRLRQIESDIEKIDALMLALARQDQRMSERLNILFSIPRIGMITALMILVDMPEISTLGSKQVASLAGLAPPLTHAGIFCWAKHVTKLGKMARKGADTGWASKLAQCHLHACARRDPV